MSETITGKRTGPAAESIDDRSRKAGAGLEEFAVSPDSPMREVLELIDRNGEGVALVLDGDRRLLGIVTDGDIRRAILEDTNFDQPVRQFLDQKVNLGWAAPFTAHGDTPEGELLRMMHLRLVRHLPLVDDDGRVTGLALLSQLAQDPELPIHAVVMAGGFGTRLPGLSQDLPKPLQPVGGKPVIEHILGQLKERGVRRVSIATHYRADMIEEHIGDGRDLGLDVRYARESKPLGTAGALGMLRDTTEPLLVMNGDILTALDVRAMLDFHQEAGSDITVGVRKYQMQVPFGVFDVEGTTVRKLEEKPTMSLFINAGVYMLEPAMLERIPSDTRLDMTDLIQRVLDGDGVVTSFPIHEYWIDVGQHKDLMRAQMDAAAKELKT